MTTKYLFQLRLFILLTAMFGLLAAAVAKAADIYIPRTSEHFKCKFPDGSYTEYKEREKWYFYAEVLPEAQTSSFLDSMLKYVDTKGKTHKYVGTEDPQCIGVGKRDGRVFWDGGFENLKGQFVDFDNQLNQKGVIAPPYQNFPKKIPSSVDQTPEVRSFMNKEFLYGEPRALILPLHNDETLLFEQPLTALAHPSTPSGTVLYVYQSISTDYGKTWSAPVITKEAKLFEIGRLLTKQSWSPKVDMILLPKDQRR
jgi:hypothetical protein